VEFLPDQVVARTPDLLAWWTPVAVRPMFFRAGSELEGISGKRFPHPALLFAVRNSVLYVRALTASQRPGPDSKLAAAPYWNIDSLNGAVCAGTMRAPKSLTVTSIAAWQQAFFQSEFTHPGGGGRLTKRRGGTTALWKDLAGKKRFPLSTLIELEPLEQYLKRLETERR
jgi:PRTRC genetic system protein B